MTDSISDTGFAGFASSSTIPINNVNIQQNSKIMPKSITSPQGSPLKYDYYPKQNNIVSPLSKSPLPQKSPSHQKSPSLQKSIVQFTIENKNNSYYSTTSPQTKKREESVSAESVNELGIPMTPNQEVQMYKNFMEIYEYANNIATIYEEIFGNNIQTDQYPKRTRPSLIDELNTLRNRNIELQNELNQLSEINK